MKKIFLLLCVVASVMTGCNNDDIDELRDKTNQLEERVKALEDMQKTLWDNIQALQAIINDASFDYVTGVTALADGSGYQLTFKRSSPIVIKHGKQGEQGNVPNIGAKQDTDGEYYWTLDGEFLLAEDGSKLLVRGEKGETGPMGPAGVTLPDGSTNYMPMVRINPDTLIWEISVDGGANWNSTGVSASGGGDSIFAADGVDTSDPDKVVLTLKDGTQISLPRYKAIKIGTDEEGGIFKVYEAETVIPLSLPADLKAEECVAIMAQIISEQGTTTTIATRAATAPWKVEVTMPSFDAEGVYQGNAAVKVTAPEGVDAGESALLRVTLVDNEGGETVTSRVLQFDVKAVEPEGEPVEAGYFYYLDGTYSQELDASKECIGIVFYVGNVAADDEVLRNKIGATDKGYHGLVVAVNELDPTIWMKPYAETGVSNNLNLLNGYSNTQTMKAWNENDANIDNQINIVFGINSYINDNPVPEGCSGWYLPSLKELVTLCSGYPEGELKNDWKARGTSVRDLVQSKLELLGDKAQKLTVAGGTRFYWSSTVVGPASHMAVGFDGGVPRDLTSNDGTNPRGARLILAF